MAVPGVSGSLFAPTRDRAVLLAWILAVTFTAIEVRGALVLPLASDSHAYWTAWRDGMTYARIPDEAGAFLYSPVFAQVIYPLTLLPWPAFAVLWFVLGIGAYWWLLRPLSAPWAIPLALVALDDLRAGQLTAVLSVACVVGVSRAGAWAVPLFTKVTPVVGVLWFVPRRDWQALIRFAAVSLVVFAFSFAVSPHLWVAWFHLIASEHGSGAPARFALAAALACYAGMGDRPWLLPLAMAVASPVGALYVLGFACAVPRLLPPEALARLTEPFGGFRSTVRRALDLAEPSNPLVPRER